MPDGNLNPPDTAAGIAAAADQDAGAAADGVAAGAGAVAGLGVDAAGVAAGAGAVAGFGVDADRVAAAVSRDAGVAADGVAAGAEDDAVHPLLEVQRLDTETEQLQHRRDTLPKRRDLNAATVERAQHQQQLESVVAQRLEVLKRQKRLEQEAAILEARANTGENRLYSGEVRAIRDLQALQEEVAGLRSRQGHLEEQSIGALLEAEALEEGEASLRLALGGSEERVTVLEAEVASAEADIDARLAEVRTARSGKSARLDPSALTTYERLRQSFGPSTAVEFDPSSGCGCPHQMPAAEVARIKRCTQGSVENCSECGRLVLR